MRTEILLIILVKFSFQPLTAEIGFDPGAVLVMFVVVTKLGQDSFNFLFIYRFGRGCGPVV
jgi:hypothetical protein